MLAATGVGAGDLATPALAASEVGFAVLSAVIVGGVVKYVLNEGITRWQYQTESTLIEGAMGYYGRVAQYLFLVYLCVWTFTVGVALISASGIAFYALFPVFEEATTGKVIYGMGLSLLGLWMVRVGGFQVFERIMSIAIVLMLITIVFTVFQFAFQAHHLNVDHNQWMISRGSLDWYLAVMGGVGGTVTILCYGYWIREHGREGKNGLHHSRIDLGLAYFITVLLGIAMVLIGTRITIHGGGAGLLVSIAAVLEEQSGTLVSWIFKLGAFAAIFSSLLGVWQSVPYLFSDLIRIMNNGKEQVEGQKSPVYAYALYSIALIPMLGLPFGFASMQKLYAICGGMFVPLLATTLILLSIHSEKANKGFKQSIGLNLVYLLIVGVFLFLFIGAVL